MKVTLNSLTSAATPAPAAPRHRNPTATRNRTGPRRHIRDHPERANERNRVLTSCSAVRPTYSSAGHEFFRQWKMCPLTIPPALPPKCHLLILAPPPSPRAQRRSLERRDPARANRRQSEVRAGPACDPGNPEEDPQARRPHALLQRVPGPSSAPLLITPAPPRIDSSPPGDRLAPAAATTTVGWPAPAGLDRIQPPSSRSPPPPRARACWRAAVVRRRRKTTDGAPRRQSLALLEEKKKKVAIAYRPRA
nr:unnamed protein product [Digitaria exilis]